MRPELTDPGASPRLLVVVAHPDDETFGCGSLLLHAAAVGMTTRVVCATRGEAGEAIDGTPSGELASVREAETRAAADALGVAQVDFLDFGDSGMSGEAAATTLVGADLAAVSEQVRRHLEGFRPSVVITLDASDGHRDHERIRDATLAAVDAADWHVQRVYLHCLPQVLMRRWVEHMIANDPSWEHLRGNVPGTPEELVTTIIDTSAYLPAREAAMRLHASQRSPFEGLPDDLRRDFLTSERLQRVRPPWPGGDVETALS
ncbi:PIG-L deacetylase family protein [uncultured Jatrophihabitans sp.]|uniref:PIG-L deacetylase family protein n=1 Tax=uncultured Jatrophihabitans sp. TaxID=1610747 RepID=UPI0035CAB3E5